MAATVEISESNGNPEVVTDGITNINFGSVDAPDLVPASFKIVKGDSSYRKYLRVHLIALNGSTRIDTCKIWKSAGAYLPGESIRFVNEVFPPNAYSPPNDDPVEDDYDPNVVDLYTSEPVGTVIAISGGGGSLESDDTYSTYFILQLQTTASIATGAVNQKTFSFQYRET